MKKKNLLLILPMLTLMFTTSCSGKDIIGSNQIKDFTFEADNFNEIEIKNIRLKNGNTTYGPNVNFFPGLEKKIQISMDENFQNEIKVKKSGNKKIISGDRTHNLVTDRFEINIYGYVLSDVDLSGACVANLNSLCLNSQTFDLSLSGASKVNIDVYQGIEFDAELSGASSLNLQSCNASDVNIDLSGASTAFINNLKATSFDLDMSGASLTNITLGNTSTIDADISGASTLKASLFEIESGEVDLSGASQMFIKVNKSLVGSASGSSTLNYSGEGAVNVKTSGGSKVSKIQ